MQQALAIEFSRLAHIAEELQMSGSDKTHKFCPGCCKQLTVDSFYKHSRQGYRSRCKECEKLAKSTGVWSSGGHSWEAWREQRKQSGLPERPGYDKDSYEENKERIKEKATKWAKENRQRVRELARFRHKKAKDDVSDAYVRRRLTDYGRCAVSPSDLPDSLVAAAAVLFRLKREIEARKERDEKHE